MEEGRRQEQPWGRRTGQTKVEAWRRAHVTEHAPAAARDANAAAKASAPVHARAGRARSMAAAEQVDADEGLRSERFGKRRECNDEAADVEGWAGEMGLKLNGVVQGASV